MCDLNWCPVCEKAISHESDSLYCSADCFLLDSKSQFNPTKFLSFLKPKSLLRKKKQEIKTPRLTKSVCTSSSLSTRSSVDSLYGEPTHDDLKSPECCDYCDSTKNGQHEKKPSSLSDYKAHQISSSPIFIPVP